ncbi:sec-independent protein translocase protein TatC [Desulfovibrio legallii]|uniref:Sec-independent protein translocase protein TatC n=1 Tax=Desulfovibrio legallii TaxID=571438 RepID=A0A1G7PYU4_9BACT|nr:twin-arginine translocase subunit TatC [Desulfovibrio legallii]SDF91393.1 sec-independent protein translocase protein TatC [Desulfovibrio legallii]
MSEQKPFSPDATEPTPTAAPGAGDAPARRPDGEAGAAVPDEAATAGTSFTGQEATAPAPRFAMPDFVAAAAGGPAAEGTAPRQEAPAASAAAGPALAAEAAQAPTAPAIAADADAAAVTAAGQPASADDFADALAVPQWQPDAAEQTATEAADAAPPTEAAGNPPPPPNAPPPAELTDDSGLPAPQEGEKPGAPDDTPMSLMDHLGELRGRLVRCCIAVGLGFLACWAVVDPIFNALVDPLLAVLPKGSHAIYTTLPEGFFTRMYIAFVAGVFVSSPVIFYQVWSFIAPGLYEEEKRYIVPVAVISALFFTCGGAFCYFMVFPYAFSFFVSFATEEIVAMPKVSDYLSFVLKLILAFGLIFEMPLFALFLARMGIITAAMMRKARRYAILGIFIVAAILTPPDVVSQLLMACPMLILYEISIGVAALFGRKNGKKAAAGAAAAGDDKTGPQPAGPEQAGQNQGGEAQTEQGQPDLAARPEGAQPDAEAQAKPAAKPTEDA